MAVIERKQHSGLSITGHWLFIVASGVISFLSKDSLLFFAGMVLLYAFLYFFFNKSVPPVLLFSAFLIWLFFQGQLIDGLAKGKDIIHLDYLSSSRPLVITLGMISSFFFFLGIYCVVRRMPQLNYEQIKSFFFRIDLSRLFRVYLIIYFGIFLVEKLIWLVPGLSQPLFILAQFKWSLFFLLFTAVFVQKKMKGVLLLLILLDIALGFFSFFSHFKEPIYFSFLAYWVFFFRQSFPIKLLAFGVVISMYYLGTYWTAVKEDYRAFLNKGSGAQSIRVSREEAYSKLIELVSGVKQNDLDKGADKLLTRLSWIGALDAVYNYVPKKRPYEDGSLWLEGLVRPFQPRLFFPEKKILADSKELNEYSGLGVDEKNTSISLSLIAGSYVDFGIWGMHVPIFLFGLFCGWVYRKVLRWGIYPMIGFALTMPMIYLFKIAEQSINRTVSSIILYFLVVWFIQKFFLKPFLNFVLVK